MFHAGTRLDGERVVVGGGRVLCVTALGHNVRTAQKRAYEIVGRIRFDGMQYRRDIGHRALERRRGARKAGRAAGARQRDASRASGLRLVRRRALPREPSGHHRRAARGARRRGFQARRLAAAARRRRHDLHTRRRCTVRARGRRFLSRPRHRPAAFGVGYAAGACRPILPGDGCLARPASAQSVRAHRAHERALLRGREERRRSGVVVRRRHGSHALLRLAKRTCGISIARAAMRLRRSARSAIRNTSAGATSTSICATATSRAASAASSSTT